MLQKRALNYHFPSPVKKGKKRRRKKHAVNTGEPAEKALCSANERKLSLVVFGIIAKVNNAQ